MKDEQAGKSNLYQSIFVVLCVVFFIFLGVIQLSPPGQGDGNEGPADFSTERALKYLEPMVQKPHPLNTPEKEKVRDYLVDCLKNMGLKPEVQADTHHSTRRNITWKLENVIVKLEGKESTGAILVVAHYDSVPTAPGAADNGAAVAALLESIRALKTLPALKNDVIFLFSDGEEYGLLGAKLFANKHPWMKDVAVVLNYEARGSRGPSLMFETNENNGWFIAQFARSAPYPRAYSWAFEVYKRMPNNTDFTVFRRKGLNGLNFAFIGGMRHYHSMMDNFENLDRRSLRHHGENLLPLLKRMGDQNLENTSEENRVYFSIFNTLVNYPTAWSYVFLIVIAGIFIYIMVYGIKRKELKISRVLSGSLRVLLLLVVTSALIYLLWGQVKVVDPGYRAQFLHSPYHSDDYNGFYVTALSLVSASVFLFALMWFFKQMPEQDLMAGALVWFFLLGIVTGVLVPGGGYLFAWPLFFGSIVLWIRLKKPETSWGYTAGICFLSLPAILMIVPNFCLLVDALGLKTAFASSNFLLILLLSLLVLPFKIVLRSFRWYFPAVLLVIGTGMLIFHP